MNYGPLTIRVPGKDLLGIRLAFSESLGLLVIDAPPIVNSCAAKTFIPFKRGDIIESVNGVHLEPANRKDAVQQFQLALAPRTKFRELRCVRAMMLASNANILSSQTTEIAHEQGCGPVTDKPTKAVSHKFSLPSQLLTSGG